MRARWARAFLAMFFASSAAALGAAALTAGPAQAATPDGTPCGKAFQPACPPSAVITADTTETDGVVTVTWTAGDANATNIAPTAAPTIQWKVQSNLPPLAPPPPTLSAPLQVIDCPATGSPAVCTYSWPPEMLDNGYVLNGTYTVTASAKGCSAILGSLACSAVATQSGSVAVANAPAKPTNVKSVVAAGGSSAVISWDPNPEPDVVGYQVLRSDNSVACEVFVDKTIPKSYACTDSPTKDGAYSYHVVALRWGATYDPGAEKVSPSGPGDATKAITLTGTAANTTTTVPGATPGTLTPPGFTGRAAPRNAGGTGVSGLRSTPRTVGPASVAGDNPAPGADTGFLPNLPYGQQPTTTVAPDPGVVASTPLVHKGKTSVGTIAVIGAGLLVAVIALHGLWLRAEVRRSGTLEALDPEV